MKHGMFPFGEKEELQRRVWPLAPGNQLVLETAFTRHNLVRLVANQTTEVDGQRHEIIRYDSCHGLLHRHLFFKAADALEELDWPINLETGFRVVADLKEQWKERLRKYLKKIGKGEWHEMETH